jgi:SAM-dependent methyltransferase
MSFPSDDRPWAETAEFLAARMGPADRLVAPDPFRFAIPRAGRFGQVRAEAPAEYDWIVVHKGELPLLPRGFLTAVPADGVPVFANEVFVVFATNPPGDLEDLTETDHVRAFWAGMEALPEEPVAPPAFAGPMTAVQVPAAATTTPVQRAVPVPRLRRDVAEKPPARPWQIPGGLPGTAREAAFQQELDRLVQDYVGTGDGLAVLDVGSGSGRLGGVLAGASQVVGVDLAPDALARARTRHAALPAFSFARMDAARLAFAEASFDLVVMLDVLDGLADPAAALAEAARVLARGGRLMVTATNKESLPFRALRRLALPVPVGGVSVQELAGMLRAAGLAPVRMDGILLPLGWALPGAGGALGPLEEDPEFVEAARLLGRRCGPDLALTIAMMARKG